VLRTSTLPKACWPGCTSMFARSSATVTPMQGGSHPRRAATFLAAKTRGQPASPG
jgi:hypothetical protein